MKIKNSKGKIYYGLHFYPGVAEYQEPGADPYRVFLNEDTLRKMDPTFAGRPVFVEHVDDVDERVDELRKDADGWVIESFFNAADGKHWVKFLVCSDRGERAIARGMRLSNCYVPKMFGDGGLWNGVSYAKEIRGGEYEHLAIVPNPRYDESVIMSPEEFKAYNDEKSIELKRLANHKKEGAGKMAFKLFKRAKVENAIDLEATLVLLPKTNREVSLMTLCNEADEKDKKANGDHMVDVGGTKMTLNELMDKHKAVCDELEGMKAEKANAAAEDDEDDKKENDDDDMENADDDGDEDDKKENGDDDDMENADDDEKAKVTEDKEKEVVAAKAKNGDKKPAPKAKNAPTADELEARRKAKEKADRLRNADKRQATAVALVETGEDKIARGKSRYGSN